MAKIKDIANAAKVSSATVSRILRNDPHLSVRDETRNDVLRIADQMGYQPTKKATKQARTVGIVQWISQNEEDADPYYYELRKAVEVNLNHLGYDVVRFYQSDIERIHASKNLSGLVCVGKFTLDQAAAFKQNIKHIIFVDSNPDASRYSSVVFDFEAATLSALDHLVDYGHRHIGFIGGREYIGPNREEYLDKRELTFLKYGDLHPELHLNTDFIYIDDFTANTGYEGILEAHTRGTMPTAFVCESDTIAMGAIRALDSLNRLDGDDAVSVIGYNDIYTSQYLNPPLTTIKLDIKGIASTTATLLDSMMKLRYTIPAKTSLSTRLIKRESVKKIEPIR